MNDSGRDSLGTTYKALRQKQKECGNVNGVFTITSNLLLRTQKRKNRAAGWGACPREDCRALGESAAGWTLPWTGRRCPKQGCMCWKLTSFIRATLNWQQEEEKNLREELYKTMTISRLVGQVTYAVNKPEKVQSDEYTDVCG